MEQLKNNSSTALDGAINDSVTSVTVDDGSVFPSSGNFRVLCESEILLVTSRSSNVLTVTRGAESTTAASHTDNTTISHIYTKGGVEQILAEYQQFGGYASRPATARKGTTYQANDMLGTWMYDGTNWNLIKPMIVPYAKRIDFSGWSTNNLGTSVSTTRNGVLEFQPQIAGQVRVYYKTMPTPPYKHTIVFLGNYVGDTEMFPMVGCRLNSSGQIRGLVHRGTSGDYRVENWATASTSRTVIMAARSAPYIAPIWLRFEDNNTNWIYSSSRDGLNYSQIYSETRNTGFTPDQIMVGFYGAYTLSSGVPSPLYLYGQWEE